MKKFFILAALVFSQIAFSTEHHIAGTVTSITSYSGGLLIRVNGNQKPSGCTQSSAWMLIKEQNKTMISVALASYMAGKRDAVVYVDADSTGYYCVVIQYDPQN